MHKLPHTAAEDLLALVTRRYGRAEASPPGSAQVLSHSPHAHTTGPCAGSATEFTLESEDLAHQPFR
jgi:hypothetical protein